MDVYYQIQKFEYLNNVADYKAFVEKSRKDHIRHYANLNAIRVLKGEKTEWKEFIAPVRPLLK